MKRNQLLARIKELQEILRTISFKRPNRLTPLVKRQADKIVEDMEKFGYKVTIFQGFRSFAEQDALYAQGRTKPGSIVTNAKAGYSLHNYGVAVDIVFVENGRPSWAEKHPWQVLGQVGKNHGFEWGGDWQGFKDRPHFEMTFGRSVYDFLSNKVDYRKYV
jgi:LAS superfamily LD-carboxypeptidase LdcB